MARLTKAKARKRLIEAQTKFVKVYMATDAVRTADMEAVEKIVARCVKRLK
mgnify:CR=1 FL=1